MFLPDTPPIFPRHHITIQDAEFVRLRDFIYSLCGIFIADNRKYLLECRLGNRLRTLGLKSFGEYFYFLKYAQEGKAEVKALYEVITTNETSFFRNASQFDVLGKILLDFFEKEQEESRRRDLQIWSAGCSTGEEPYTLAIVLHEILQDQMPFWNIRILAGDLSHGVLTRARRGEYTPYALRTTPKHIIARYFTRQDNGNYLIHPEIKKRVYFEQMNLRDRALLRTLRRSHIIFCRNVLIYFDDVMKKRVVSSLYDNLLPGGYLFIGHSESLHSISRVFKPIHQPGVIVYRKENCRESFGFS